MDIETRVQLILNAYHNINNSPCSEVIESLLPLFYRLGYQSTFMSGIPLPGQSMASLIFHNDWPSAAHLRSTVSEKDIVIQKAIGWRNAFVLKNEFHDISIFGRLAEKDTKDIGILVCPIDVIPGYQAVVVQYFRASAMPVCDQESQLVSYRERIAYSMLLNALFHQLFVVMPERFSRKGELTRREKDVLSIAALGNTSQETAIILNVKERTVITHLQNAAQKLGATNRTECVLLAMLYHQIGPGAGLGFYQIEHEIYPSLPDKNK